MRRLTPPYRDGDEAGTSAALAVLCAVIALVTSTLVLAPMVSARATSPAPAPETPGSSPVVVRPAPAALDVRVGARGPVDAVAYPYATDPSTPADPTGPGTATKVGHAGEPGVPAPRTATAGGALANTGADVTWLTGAAAVMILGGALALGLARRDRRCIPDTTEE